METKHTADKEQELMQAVISLVFSISDGGYKLSPDSFEHWEEPLVEWTDLVKMFELEFKRGEEAGEAKGRRAEWELHHPGPEMEGSK